MKTLTMNPKIVVSIIAVLLLMCGVQGVNYVYAQNNAPELTPVSDRTQQVQDKIVAVVPGVDAADDVTAAHLALITGLNLSDQNITTLKAGDFDGLSALSSLDLGSNELSSLPAEIFSGLSAMRRLNLSYNSLDNLPADTFSGLSALTGLDLGNNELSSLPEGLFSGLSSLNWLSLSSNQLSSLPAGIFLGLSSLNSLFLSGNTVDLSITVSLEKVGENRFKATTLTGAPFNIVLPVTVTNGSIDGGAATITIAAGSVESGLLTVIPTPGTSDAVTVDIGALPELPTNHFGYSLAKPGGDAALSFALGIPKPTGDPKVNHAPIFTEGIATTRSIAENTPAGRDIGGPVTATDEDEDVLTYSLSGADAASFGIVSTTGQLRTQAPLDYEQKNTYAVTVTVSDGSATDTISVTIDVTDVKENNAPVFVEGSATERSIAENTPAGRNIGGPVTATDEDEDDVLVYSLSGTDAASFGIVSRTGQLRTRAPLDYEEKDTYAVIVSVSDGNGGSDTISVAINVTDVEENNAPVFVEGSHTTRTVAENTPAGRNIGAPVTAIDEDEEDVLVYSLSGVDAASFGIVVTTGQLRTRAPLDYEQKNVYAVTVLVSDGNGGSDAIGVAINVTDIDETPTAHAPEFIEGSSTERAVAENTPAGRNIGAPVTATDEDEDDVLVYSLSGVDAVSFGIVSATGQLRTRAPLDYEEKNAYAVTVIVSDGTLTDAIGVAINVTDVAENRAPVFASSRTTRSIPENTPAGRNIGSPITATDADGDTLTYSIDGTDASSFGIVSSTGQLKTRAPLDYEEKNAYAVTVSAFDGTLTDTISVGINVTDVAENRAPVFASSRTTRTVAENTPAGSNIGSPITATDADGDALTYTLSGTDAAAFGIVGTTGQLRTRAPLDYETKKAYAVTVTASDGEGGRDTISVAINVTDLNEAPPVVEETPPTVVESPLTVEETPVTVGVPPRPAQGESVVSISEIMFGSERSFTPVQWIELHNAGPNIINLAGWEMVIKNVNSPELTGSVRATITFKDDFWGDAPRLWPNDVVLVVGSTDSNSKNLAKDQIYDLDWRTSLPIGFWTTWLSTEGFSIKLIDAEGNLVDEAGNLKDNVVQWQLPYGQNRGRTRAGHRTSMIRRYADSLPLDGTQAGGWISAADANLTANQLTYYGDKDDISTPGIGIVINDISPQFVEYDVNRDGVVNISDLVLVAGRLAQSGPNAADVNGDGVVNVQDLILVAGAINEPQAAPSLHPTALEMFTAADIRGWLTQAHGLTLTDSQLQNGIRFLEQLLAVLVPKETELLPNYPNPFNPETWIPYRLAEDALVTVTIYDPRGRVVRKLDVGYQIAAAYESRSKAIYWDGRNAVGDKVASGIYFYTLTAGDFSATRKMLILK